MHLKKVLLFLGVMMLSCACAKKTGAAKNEHTAQWSYKRLKALSFAHLDTAKWDKALFEQDINNYDNFAEVFQAYPINKSPFPVAEYDYSVSSKPFLIETTSSILKGIIIGEYISEESNEIKNALTILVLTNDKSAEELTLVESRNYPYLTAEGFFKVSNNQLDWVFSKSPDGYATLMLNMKLFDLRFGETIIIIPRLDRSFHYYQLEDSPDNYKDIEQFKQVILSHKHIQSLLSQKGNLPKL